MLNGKDEQLRLRAEQLLNATKVEKPPDFDNEVVDQMKEKSLHEAHTTLNKNGNNDETVLSHGQSSTNNDDILDKQANQENFDNQESENHEFEEHTGDRQEEYKNETDALSVLDKEERTSIGHSILLDNKDKNITNKLNEIGGDKNENEISHDKEELTEELSNEENKNNERTKETHGTIPNKADHKDGQNKDNDFKNENAEVGDTDIALNTEESYMNKDHTDNTTDSVNVKEENNKDIKGEIAKDEDTESHQNDHLTKNKSGNAPLLTSEELNSEKDIEKEEHLANTEGLGIKDADENGEEEVSDKDFLDSHEEHIDEMKETKISNNSIESSKENSNTSYSFTSKSSTITMSTKYPSTSTIPVTPSTTLLFTSSPSIKSTQSTSMESLNYKKTTDPHSKVTKSLVSSTSKVVPPKTKSTIGSLLMDSLSTTLSSVSRKKDDSHDRITAYQGKNSCPTDR